MSCIGVQAESSVANTGEAEFTVRPAVIKRSAVLRFDIDVHVASPSIRISVFLARAIRPATKPKRTDNDNDNDTEYPSTDDQILHHHKMTRLQSGLHTSQQPVL
jgi:hypothetical protein